MKLATDSSPRSPGLRSLGLVTWAAFFGLLLTLAMALTAVVDSADHERYSRALRQTLEFDARLDEEVANARLGVVKHYDNLVRVADRITATNDELDVVPNTIAGDERRVLLAATRRYRRALDEKSELVERFKTDQAVLRNSLRALPRNAERTLATAGPDHPETARALERLLEQVLLVIVAPDEARTRAARCALVDLGDPANADDRCTATTIPVEVPEALVRDVDAVRTHARTVLERSAAVEAEIAALMALPVSARAEELRESYAQMHMAAVARARMHWFFAFGFAIGFLGLGAAWIIARLRANATVLRETKTRLEQALDELEVERDREAELAALKSRFVSMTSHEFRTPLSVILSSAELLGAYGQRWEEERRALHLDRIKTSTNTMSRMLDDVLLIGRAEAGMLELKAAPVDLAALAGTVIDEVRASVGLERELQFAEDCGDAPVLVDENLLRHVLTNLLSNAFKYSPGDSTVHFSICRDGEGALFEIRDKGIGIPPEEESQLFDAFHRCANAKSIPGTGLGLAVVKKSVEVHRGTIEVDTTLGEGTVFSVRIPFLPEAA